ncbi:MAG: shikimate dehydrogenase [Bauldia sp.]|nr:shikimate dehydrogenase [Bauldia sp.]
MVLLAGAPTPTGGRSLRGFRTFPNAAADIVGSHNSPPEGGDDARGGDVEREIDGEAGTPGVREPRARQGHVLTGLVGRGIQKSRSPAMHEAAGRHCGLALEYRLLDVDRMGPPTPSLGAILDRAEAEGFAGVNVTHPYKQEVLRHLGRISDSARAVGAVNTVVFGDGERIGHNTDSWGFREAFRAELGDARRDTVVLLGAGGGGAAVSHALMETGVGRLLVIDPEPDRAAALVAKLDAQFGGGRVVVAANLAGAIAAADGVINATPVGMDSHPGSPVPDDLVRPSMWVADIVYFPIETELLRTARAKGCRTMGGGHMAILQAARAFEHFTGLTADVETMRAAFLAAG